MRIALGRTSTGRLRVTWWQDVPTALSFRVIVFFVAFAAGAFVGASLGNWDGPKSFIFAILGGLVGCWIASKVLKLPGAREWGERYVTEKVKGEALLNQPLDGDWYF